MKKSRETDIDYRKYRDKYALLIPIACVFWCLFFAAGQVFSRNLVLSCAFGFFGCVIAMNSFISWRRKIIMKKIEVQFAEVMQMILSSVSAGMPVERAFGELSERLLSSRADLKLITREIDRINRGVEMNYSFYDLLDRFAQRSGSGDIINMAKALNVAGTMGGSTAYIIRNALANMRVKIEMDKEIEHTLALPKYNHRIITAMPFLLVLMLRFISEEYVDVLYNTRAGQIVVVCVAAAVLLAWLLGDNICKVKV